MQHPLLIGENIYLRGLESQDLDGQYFQWLNDPEVSQGNSYGRFPNTRPEMEAFYQQAIQAKSDLILAVVRKDGDEHIGNISLQRIHWINRNAEYAVLIGEKTAWGKGFGLEASLLILRHGFTELNLHRIYCATFDTNEGMKKLALAMGMKEEGRRKDAAFKGGNFIDVVEYGILREDFMRQFPAKK